MLECIAPQEIEEGDLLAYLEGDASQQVVEHIGACDYCQAGVKQLEQVDALLDYGMYRVACPSMDDLLEFQVGFLPIAEARPIQRHVDSCPNCQAEMVALQAAAPALATKGVASIESTLDALTQTAVDVAAKVSQMGKQMLKAILIAAPAQPAMALRGERQEDIYQAGPYQVMLVKEPPLAGENIWQIEGQITQEAAPLAEFSGEVHLLMSEKAVAHDVVDEFGCFAFSNVKSGTYTLRISLTDELIEVEVLQLN